MLELLKTRFGYDEFRPGQREIIEHALNGGDAFVLMPTGGGKSLCYQLPSLTLEGLTLVISPLISLMEDQVNALEANGIRAAFINSSLNAGEIREREEAALNGRLKILYLAPERLATRSFLDFLQTLRVSLIAIDEAHCISEWGHDFRPDYRNLTVLRRQFPAVPVMALTATATPKVRADIVSQLELKAPKIFVAGFDRPNLTYVVRPKRQAFEHLLKILEGYRGQSVIIYCFSRKETESLAADLRAEGHNALAYHAGLPAERRKKTQDEFRRDRVDIIVATIAFGMGIDKPDVRLVVHYSLPKSIEGYYQETGRAGRDGLPSECVLFFSFGDTFKHNFFINQMGDAREKENARQKLDRVVEYCQRRACRRKYLLDYFAEGEVRAAGILEEPALPADSENCGGCDVCLSPKEEFDGTIVSQKILSAVLKTGGRFGVKYVADVLRGAKSAAIKARGHERLSVYGLIRDFSSDELKEIIRFLVERKLLVKSPGDYPTLSVGRAGREFLDRKEKIVLPKVQFEVEPEKAARGGDLEYDRELFERLRTLRKRLADERGVPPFVIFGDASLIQMAFYLPQDRENFGRINGVGREKLDRFGPVFTEEIKTYAREKGLSGKAAPAKRKERTRTTGRAGSTYEETKRFLADKLPLETIAQERGLAVGTILGHLEKMIQEGEELEIGYLRPRGERFERIKEAFDKMGGLGLSPVRGILGEDYSWEELRLARLFI